MIFVDFEVMFGFYVLIYFISEHGKDIKVFLGIHFLKTIKNLFRHNNLLKIR